jgi:1-deoxy-D-xylulose-5-phosphate reductoisomerase
MVEYIDNSVIAQLSVPDMRLCAQYALSYPDRAEAVIDELDLIKLATLSFNRPDTETFALLRCAIDAANAGGAVPAVLNAANEVAVAAFLERKLSFYGIVEVVTEAVETLAHSSGARTLDEILSCDAEARELTELIISRRSAF